MATKIINVRTEHITEQQPAGQTQQQQQSVVLLLLSYQNIVPISNSFSMSYKI